MNPSRRWRAAALALMFPLAGCSGSMTPPHEAARSGNTEVVRSYVQAKRNLDPRWDEPGRSQEGNHARLIGLTPLMLAARYGKLEAARLLVEGGADLYAVNAVIALLKITAVHPQKLTPSPYDLFT